MADTSAGGWGRLEVEHDANKCATRGVLGTSSKSRPKVAQQVESEVLPKVYAFLARAE